MQNIFVVGLEPFNLALLESLPEAARYQFLPLLDYDEVVRPARRRFDLDALLDKAERQLAAFDGRIDAIIGYWDFPASVIVPVLRRRLDLPGPPIEAVAACEHKYWSRLEQQKAIPGLVPRFEAVDPFEDDPLAGISLPFPFWLKPIKAHSSYLGFRIDDAEDFRACLPIVRQGIRLFGDPFNSFLAMLDLPAEVRGIGGSHCIAEEIISEGEQCTLEGFAHEGTVEVYGVVHSIRSGRHGSCFSRYQYPSHLPERVQARMIDAATRFVRHIGYDNAPFNIEFYWAPRTDEIRLLEANTRISKSHCPLFRMVDGVSHQQVAIDAALGRRPHPQHRRGAFSLAAKFMERIFEDGVVEGVPTADEIRRFGVRFPEGLFHPLVGKGERLAHLSYQDSYSFEIAEIFLGAEDEARLLEKHRVAVELLPFRIARTGAEVR